MKKSHQQRVLQANGKQLDLSTPKIMAIVNVTPDSFFQDSRFYSRDELVDNVGFLIENGADIIDLGGMSSRPGAEIISAQEEIERLLPAIEGVRNNFPNVWISIDTWRSEVLRSTARTGIDIVNDISGGKFDEDLFQCVGELGLPYILMYMPGDMDTMHKNEKRGDVIHDASRFFHEKITALHHFNVWDIILDPGFGFGKTLKENYQLLGKLNHFDFFGLPTLVGISRKSMIQKVIGKGPEEALNGTTALHMKALENGASILRVHDVVEAKEAILLHQQLIDAYRN